MEEIKSMLHLDAKTVYRQDPGENLEELKKNGFYEHCDALLAEKSKKIGREIKRTDIIRSFDESHRHQRFHRHPARQPGPGRLCPSSTPPAPRPCSRRP